MSEATVGNGQARETPRRIYMDYQASTPLDPRAFEAMEPYFLTMFGNPHSTDHAFGWEADAAVDRARGQVAALIGADPDEIIFTSGATEANNPAILGTVRVLRGARRRVVVSAIEHKSVLAVARAAEQEGFEVITVPVDSNGIVNLTGMAAVVNQQTALVSLMAVNSEIGTVQPISDVAELCRRAGAVFHTDAAQALAVLPLDVVQTGVDLLSLSGHKAYGPKGIGALYVRRALPVRLQPIIHGGGQEYGLRSGTLPTPLCVGLGEACALLAVERESEVERIAALRDRLLAGLRAAVPELQLNGAATPRHPGNLNVQFPGVEAGLLLNRLQPGLAVSSGSACTSGTQEPSHVLRAVGLSAEQAECSIRLSIGRFTEEHEIDAAVSQITMALTSVR